MSTLDTLIRLHRWQLDEQRRRVVEFETLADRLRAELQRLDEEEIAEQQIAGDCHEASFTYSGYARALIERREKLAKSLADTEQQTALAREGLETAFQEVKRYETAAANRLLGQHKQLARLQQLDLDEVAGAMHRRRQEAKA
jgi:flagellar export protein FliJ